MNLHILQPEVQEFINKNLAANLSKLILKGSPFNEVSIQEIATQIQSKNKCQKKLPTWFDTQNIYYPNTIHIEQTSSEITANYKATLIDGNSIFDCTGGFGVDCFFFSKYFKQVVHCEMNKELSAITNHNYTQLNCANIKVFSGDGLEYLTINETKFDWIYIDPSRRNQDKGKVFLLKDCVPNVPENLDFFFDKSNYVLIKNSPILDITQTIKELKFVKEIHVVSVMNEVKELLILLEKNYESSIKIKTINYQKEQVQLFDFDYGINETSQYSAPLTYLYEPNAAILKSGGFHQVANHFGLKKIHPHSHLYTSNQQIDFPGRVFKIDAVLPCDKKSVQYYLKEKKANITTRNFPESVAQIRKKTKIKEGGDNYLFYTTDCFEKKTVLCCFKL